MKMREGIISLGDSLPLLSDVRLPETRKRDTHLQITYSSDTCPRTLSPAAYRQGGAALTCGQHREGVNMAS